MPIYEYECCNCQEVFDTLRSYHQADIPIRCEFCNSLNTKRKLSVFSSINKNSSEHHTGSGCSNCSGGNCATCR